MAWIGTWRNQYGSELDISDESNGRIAGAFRTALRDSGFFGETCEVVGVHVGDCLTFSFGGRTTKGDMVCSFSGVLRDGKLQTVWHVISDATEDRSKRPWPHAVMTNADTFERVDA